MLEEGFNLLEKLNQAETLYQKAKNEYLDWYFKNAPFYERKKLKMQLLLEEFAITALTITAFAAGFILGKYTF